MSITPLSLVMINYDMIRVRLDLTEELELELASTPTPSLDWLDQSRELERRNKLKFCCWKLCACGHWVNILQHKSYVPLPGLLLDILKMESWTHVGHTANMIIKDVIHVFCVHQQNHAYFADGTA